MILGVASFVLRLRLLFRLLLPLSLYGYWPMPTTTMRAWRWRWCPFWPPFCWELSSRWPSSRSSLGWYERPISSGNGTTAVPHSLPLVLSTLSHPLMVVLSVSPSPAAGLIGSPPSPDAGLSDGCWLFLLCATAASGLARRPLLFLTNLPCFCTTRTILSRPECNMNVPRARIAPYNLASALSYHHVHPAKLIAHTRPLFRSVPVCPPEGAVRRDKAAQGNQEERQGPCLLAYNEGDLGPY